MLKQTPAEFPLAKKKPDQPQSVDILALSTSELITLSGASSTGGDLKVETFPSMGRDPIKIGELFNIRSGQPLHKNVMMTDSSGKVPTTWEPTVKSDTKVYKTTYFIDDYYNLAISISVALDMLMFTLKGDAYFNIDEKT